MLQDVWINQFLKCPLSVFSFPRFSSFPTLKLFSWQFSDLWNTCHTSHQMAPSHGIAKWLSPRLWISKSKGSTEGWKKFSTGKGVMHIIWRMLKICWLSAATYIQCRRLKKNAGWQGKIVMLMGQNLQHLKHTKLCAKLALVPLGRDNVRRAPVLTGTKQAAACSSLTAWSMGNNLEL